MFNKAKLLSVFALGIVCSSSWAADDNTLYTDPISVTTGESGVELSVYLENNVTICNLQFDIKLPEGIDVLYDEDEELYAIEKGGRCKAKHNIDCLRQPDGSYRVLIASTSNVEFYETAARRDLPICVITFDVPSDFAMGEYEIKMNRIVINHFEPDAPEAENTIQFLPSEVETPFSVSKSISLNAYGFATFSSNANYEVSGVTAYSAVVNGSYLDCSSLPNNIIPANTGVLLFGEPNAPVTFSVVETASPAAINDLLPTSTEDGLSNLPSTGKVYALKNASFVRFVGSTFVPNKAYIHLGTSPERVGIRFDEPTGIETIDALLGSGLPVYDFMGQAKDELQLGGNIIDGQKVIIE